MGRNLSPILVKLSRVSALYVATDLNNLDEKTSSNQCQIFLSPTSQMYAFIRKFRNMYTCSLQTSLYFVLRNLLSYVPFVYYLSNLFKIILSYLSQFTSIIACINLFLTYS